MDLLTIADVEEVKKKIHIGDYIFINVDLKEKDDDPEYLFPAEIKITGIYPHFVTTNCSMCPTLKYTDIIRGRT